MTVRNYVQKGDTLSLTAPYAIASGAGFKVGSIFAVASGPADSGAAVEGTTVGVFDLAKTSAQAWTQGAAIYWDDTEGMHHHQLGQHQDRRCRGCRRQPVRHRSRPPQRQLLGPVTQSVIRHRKPSCRATRCRLWTV